MHNLLFQGRDMKYIAGHYNMSLATARSLGLSESDGAQAWALQTLVLKPLAKIIAIFAYYVKK